MTNIQIIFQIKPITLELLKIIRETENDDLMNVMQLIVMTYTEQLRPIAVEMCQHLVSKIYYSLEFFLGGQAELNFELGFFEYLDSRNFWVRSKPINTTV